MRLSVLIAVLALVLPAPTPVRAEADVTGWWKADIAHGGETEPLYLHFANEGGKLRVRFTTPRVRISEADLGLYAVSDDHLRLPGIGWTLKLGEGGAAIDGIMPDALFTAPAPLHFTRVDGPPTLPPGPKPRRRAPSPRWKTSVGAEVWAGLVYEPKRRAVIVADDFGQVTALAVGDGARLWRQALGSPIRATPIFAEGRLFVASDAALVALDAASGRRLWERPFGPALSPRLPIFEPASTWDHYTASAAADGGVVAIAGRDGCVAMLSAATGAQSWRHCFGTLITSTPVITRDGVFFGGFDGAAYKLSRRDGAVLWRHETHFPIPRDAVVDGGRVLFGSRSYDLVALDAASGRQVWDRFFWFSWIDSVPVVRGGIVYTGSSDALVVQALDAATGRRIWSSPVDGWSWARVAVGPARVYSALVGGRYTAPRAGGLAAIDRKTGKLDWLLASTAPADPRRLHGFASAPLLAAGQLFAADLDGNVYAFETSE